MVSRSSHRLQAAARSRAGARVLVIEGRFYEAISNELLAGAVAELEAHGVGHEVVTVPGALEIPQVLAGAVAAGLFAAGAEAARFSGAVALGCVIRGETSHYDIVCNNANHWLMQVAVTNGVAVGNAILTVDSEAQALARACGGRQGKGGDAVRACLAMIDIGERFRGARS